MCATRQTLIDGKYRLESPLGEGGMGVVWRAFNEQLQAEVAIKLLRPELVGGGFAERLRSEARAAASLTHPSIVRVFDVGQTEAGEPFIVMELLSGESLGDVIERGPLSAVRAVQLLLPIVEGLALAHSRGVVHRDLKPDNIFLTVEGGMTRPKLLDFGIAKLSGDAGRGVAKQTQSGELLGSPEYMSPEQACGRPDVDHRSDIWSLCVVLYEALSGEVPFLAAGPLALLRKIVDGVALPLEVLGVDSKLSALVQRGLAKEPGRRYSSMLELGQALAAWLLEQGVHEDVTGAFISAKWLGRSSDRPEAPQEHAGAEQVSPSVRIRPAAWRGRRFIPKAAAAMLIFAGAGLGGKVLASPTAEPAALASTQAPEAAAATASLLGSGKAMTAPLAQLDSPKSLPTAGVAKLEPGSRVNLAQRSSRRESARSAPVTPAPEPRTEPKHDLLDPYQ